MAQEGSIRQQMLDQKRQFWKTHIASWQASRLSQAEYCRRHELKFHQFVYWRRKFTPKPSVPICLVQVPVAAVARPAISHSRQPCGCHWRQMFALKSCPDSTRRRCSLW